MTKQHHPITPPPELLQQWLNEEDGIIAEYLATRAARWGADQELEACIDAIARHPGFESPELFIEVLRATRRPKPKPPSLAEQALAALDQADKGLSESEWQQRSDTIRAALGRLQELEGEQ